MESLSGRAFRYRAQVVGASVKETFFHSKIRAKHVYAETPEDIPRLLAPVYFDASGWRARGYFHKRAHMTVMGMGRPGRAENVEAGRVAVSAEYPRRGRGGVATL